MSNKVTIRHGEDWCLYQECLETDGVYLNLENIEVHVHSDGCGTNVTIRLDNKLAEAIGITNEKDRQIPSQHTKVKNSLGRKQIL